MSSGEAIGAIAVDEARGPEQILSEMTRLSRGLRPFLILAIVVVIGSLSASVVYLYRAQRTAEAAKVAAETELERLRAATGVIAAAKDEQDPARRDAILSGGLKAAEQAQAPQRPAQLSLSAINVTVFACQGASGVPADGGARVLRLKPAGASGSWQTRPLSPTQNARWNYRLTDNQVRYNPEEEDAADQLIAALRGTLGIEARKVLTFYPTPSAMSLFLCDGAVLIPAA